MLLVKLCRALLSSTRVGCRARNFEPGGSSPSVRSVSSTPIGLRSVPVYCQQASGDSVDVLAAEEVDCGGSPGPTVVAVPVEVLDELEDEEVLLASV